MREGLLCRLHALRSPKWTVVNAMRVPESFDHETDRQPVLLADLSCLIRAGLKGPGAADWLAKQGLPVPPRPNSWGLLPGGGIIARLAETEFFLEDSLGGRSAADAARALGNGAAGIYPVLRQDVGLVLWGTRANDVLLQTCNVNFASIDPQRHELVLTSMIGVSVLVIPHAADGAVPMFRIWADPTFGPYVWETLLEIVAELGGGPAGFASCPPYPEHTDLGGGP